MSRLGMSNKSKLAAEFIETGRLSSISIIDVHTHMGPFHGTYMPETSLEAMIHTMDRENIEWIISSAHSALFDPILGNGETEAAMKQYPDKIYGYFAFNPHYDNDLEERLAHFQQTEGYVGFKFLPDRHLYPLDGDKYTRIYEYAHEHKLMLLSHTWGHSPYNPPGMVEKLAKKYPGITFLLGHSAPGESDYAIQIAKTLPNVYLDLCDTGRLNGIIKKMVQEASSEKVIFGTDLPWYDPHYMLGSVLFSGIDDADMANIIHHNAVRLLKQKGNKQKGNKLT
ncbi:amidohydrolase family protein [Paenibacillus eucommiae]|uniref:TIM-barrel fold metal-dependent hydrolase n=1 Tax=Paenibacillus eucommiae TaxID=1355755 RepID=A0ABS4ITZ3_9BACL|nr:amidohydrolase family protein [Paenibacillus eucommiae]MBP1991040.1 putative TIM-barrel fold metal-dependent hydrolase [Paenibacillus eucommiae]